MNETHTILSQSANHVLTIGLSTTYPRVYGYEDSLLDVVFTPCIPDQ